MRAVRCLEYLPVSFFAMVMGLCGLALSWRSAQDSFGLAVPVDSLVVAISAVLLVLLLVGYGAKWLRYPQAVRAELHHPIQLNFFATISVSILLLGTALLPDWPELAQPIWLIGTLLHLGFTVYVVNAWIHHEGYELQHINPAWFIPAVGNVLVPIAGVRFGYLDLSWFAFSVGIVFWLLLFGIILYRMLFHLPLPQRLLPTLFILIAPPAAGFIAYLQLVGGLDPFARVLYFVGLFLTILLVAQFNRFARLEFFLSWWAYSFPLAAITVATLLMHRATGASLYRYLGVILLVVVTAVVVLLLVKTAAAARAGRICVPGG